MSERESKATSNAAWQDHEHTATNVDLEAKKLLRSAGSPELAKHAVDAAAENLNLAKDRSEELAELLGFASYRSLVEASTMDTKVADRQWFVISIRPDQWILWNDRDLEVAGVFESLQDAQQAIN
jgi:hypothetical protein